MVRLTWINKQWQDNAIETLLNNLLHGIELHLTTQTVMRNLSEGVVEKLSRPIWYLAASGLS